jgi:hypothetical protein
MSRHSCRKHPQIHALVIARALAALIGAFALPADAQTSSTDGTNGGAIRFSGGADVPSVYVFRGILQETDPRLTLWPYGDLTLALHSGDGALKSVAANLGVWNSLQTGSSGSDGPSGHLHYREDFHASLRLGLGGGTSFSIGYAALTSPNNMFNTIKEVQLKVTKVGWLDPYGFVAAELTDDGQADIGAKKGTYLELGLAPNFALGGKATLTTPAKVGLSLKDYYELAGKDQKYGYFDVGGVVTLPLSGVPLRFGRWNVHGAVDVFALGDTAKAFNQNKSSKVVGSFGVSLSY